MSTTSVLLSHVRSLGYTVTGHVGEGRVELRAAKVGELAHVARCDEGDGEEEQYRAAVLLARAVGVKLRDG